MTTAAAQSAQSPSIVVDAACIIIGGGGGGRGSISKKLLSDIDDSLCDTECRMSTCDQAEVKFLLRAPRSQKRACRVPRARRMFATHIYYYIYIYYI